jgi:hypothetical protein
MKSKIIFGSIICFLAFMLSSLQTFNKKKYQLFELKTIGKLSDRTQNQTSCAKCHDCKGNNFVVQDSINPKTILWNYKTEKNVISNKKSVLEYLETIDFTDENNPDNHKIR